MSFNINNKAKAKVGVGILASALALALLLPASAFAATMKVTVTDKSKTLESKPMTVKVLEGDEPFATEQITIGEDRAISVQNLLLGKTYKVYLEVDDYPNLMANTVGGEITEKNENDTITAAIAIETKSKVTGTVKDKNGSPIANTTIKFYTSNVTTGDPYRTATSGADGTFQTNLGADTVTYTITATPPTGYVAPSPKTLALTADQKTASVDDFVLSPDTTASNTQTTNTTANTTNKAATNTSNTTADDTALSQTGDASMAILGIGAATAALAALATWAFSKRRRR